MRSALAVALVAVVALAGCAKKDLAPRISGERIAQGAPVQVYASPDGAWAAALVEAAPAKEQGAPQDLLLGALVAAPVTGGEARRLGGGVSNLPGHVLFSKNGLWLGFLAGYSVRKGTGELRLARKAGEAEAIAPNVSFFTFNSAGTLAYVADGELFVRAVNGETTSVTTGVSMAEFLDGELSTRPGAAPLGRLLVKRRAQTGGALLSYDLATKKLTAIARGVGGFTCSPDGSVCAFDAQGPLAAGDLEPESPFAPKQRGPAEPGLYVTEELGPAKKVSGDIPSEIRFSPNYLRLAYVTQPKGSANAGDLWIMDRPNAPKVVQQKIQNFQFSPDGSLAVLGAFDSTGTAKLYLLDATATQPFEVAKNVKVLPQSPRAYGFSPQGKWLLFHQVQVLGGHYTMVLGAWKIGQPRDQAPRWIDTGAFGYVMNADERRLAYKARCIDQGRACGLFVQDLETPPPGALAAEGMPGVAPVVSRVAAFEWVPGDDLLAIITSRRGPKLSGQLLFALGVVAPQPNATVRLLDDQISGDFAFAGPDRRTLVYAVSEKDREGLYKATIANAAVPQAGAKPQ